MSIMFRLRKYGTCIDASYFLMDGKEMFDAASCWLIGDRVSVMFDATEEMRAAVSEQGREGFAIYEGKAHIPCRVVSRSHAIAWTRIGEFQVLCTSFALEADDGWWEDLLLWITKGTRPRWANNAGELSD